MFSLCEKAEEFYVIKEKKTKQSDIAIDCVPLSINYWLIFSTPVYYEWWPNIHKAVVLVRRLHLSGYDCVLMQRLSLPSFSRDLKAKLLAYFKKITSSKNPCVIDKLCFNSVNSLKFRRSASAFVLISFNSWSNFSNVA